MSAAVVPWQQFICRVCGLVYDERLGDADSGLAAGTRWADIPDDWACPVCGVGKADFEPHVPVTARLSTAGPVTARISTAGPVTARLSMAGPTTVRAATRGDDGVLIVGAGRAGWAVAQALRDQGCSRAITMVSACSGDRYDKPQLSVAVARNLDLATLVREDAATAAARLGVRLRVDTHAVAIDVPTRRLRTTRGTLRWRQLVLAQGAEPAWPAALPAAHVWRVNDLVAYRRLRAALAGGPQRVAIVGAGLVGCELANDLALAGHTVTLLDLQDRPLAAVLPGLASQRLLQAWQGLPIHFRGGVQVRGVDAGAVLQLRLSDGSALTVDRVVAATGLRTAGRLAASAGLLFDSVAGGIVVDAATGSTSVPGIHALGDCVVVDGRASRYIEPITRQAQAVAAHLDGRAAPAGAAPTAPVLRVKTSALPITVTTHVRAVPPGSGRWHVEHDAADELRLLQSGARGERLATLVARTPGR